MDVRPDQPGIPSGAPEESGVDPIGGSAARARSYRSADSLSGVMFDEPVDWVAPMAFTHCGWLQGIWAMFGRRMAEEDSETDV